MGHSQGSIPHGTLLGPQDTPRISPDVEAAITELQKDIVIICSDKAANKMALICTVHAA